MDGLLQLLKNRLDLEEKNMIYATKVSRGNLYELEIKGSSSEKALGYLKNYHLSLSKENFEYHKRLQDEVVKRLDLAKNYRAAEISKYRSGVQLANREVAAAIEGLTRAKLAYAKAKDDFEKAKIKLSQKEQAVKDAEKLSEEKRKEKERDPQKASKWGSFVSALVETTPEQEREKYKKQFKKVQLCHKTLIDCTGDIVARKKGLAQKIEERDGSTQMVSRCSCTSLVIARLILQTKI